MSNFCDLIAKAKNGENRAKEELLKMYYPMLAKESIVSGIFDEDLYQELCIKFIECIDKFEV